MCWDICASVDWLVAVKSDAQMCFPLSSSINYIKMCMLCLTLPIMQTGGSSLKLLFEILFSTQLEFPAPHATKLGNRRIRSSVFCDWGTKVGVSISILNLDCMNKVTFPNNNDNNCWVLQDTFARCLNSRTTVRCIQNQSHIGWPGTRINRFNYVPESKYPSGQKSEEIVTPIRALQKSPAIFSDAYTESSIQLYTAVMWHKICSLIDNFHYRQRQNKDGVIQVEPPCSKFDWNSLFW